MCHVFFIHPPVMDTWVDVPEDQDAGWSPWQVLTVKSPQRPLGILEQIPFADNFLSLRGLVLVFVETEQATMLSCNPSCLSWSTKSQSCVCTAAMHYHMEVVCLLSGPNRSWGHKYVTQGMCCDLLTEGEKNKARSTWYADNTRKWTVEASRHFSTE